MRLKNMLVIGVAALALAAVYVQSAAAQEQWRSIVFTNSAFPTAYAPTTSTNFLAPTATLTNAQTLYSPSTATPMSIRAFQDRPVTFQLVAANYTAGVSNTTVGLDLSPDNIYWTSNSILLSITQNNSQTNMSVTTYGQVNSTNVFTGYQWARWSYGTTINNTNLTLLQFQALVLR